MSPFSDRASARERREADLFWTDLVGRPRTASGPNAEGEDDPASGCPSYERGEARASRREPGILGMPVAKLKGDTFLVADFATGSGTVKPATKRDPALLEWLARAKSNPDATFEVVGYSDCIDSAARNDRLRAARARNVADLAGSTDIRVTPAALGTYLASNLTRVGRAMNRGATIQVFHRPPYVAPESVAEMKDTLDDAENLLVDPALIGLRERQRLYGLGPLPSRWAPDVSGAIKRMDDCLGFAKPLVDPAHIKSHARDDLQATAFGLFYTTDWLNEAATSYAEARRLRDQTTSTDVARVSDLAVKVKSLLAFRAAEKLRVLADEGLSFELEYGLIRPAPGFRRTMRAEFTGGGSRSKRELRVLAWLRDNKDTCLDAEQRFKTDRRAIGATIAWEAMHNILRGGLRGVGPGKMHTYSRQLAGALPFLPKGEAIPQQVEARGLVPAPKSDDDRIALLAGPRGAITYIAAAMRAATDIAAGGGYDISHDLGALTSFYQGYDLPGWEKHVDAKKRKKETSFVAADTMALWTISNVDFLESALGRPSP